MAACARWFADATGGKQQHQGQQHHHHHHQQQQQQQQQYQQPPLNVLMFNCMKERDPSALLPPLRAALARRGAPAHAALFVPPDSQYAFLARSGGQQAAAAAAAPPADVSWQLQLRDVWERAAGAESAAPTAAAASASAAPSPADVEAAAAASRLLRLPPLPAAAGAAASAAAQDAARGAVAPSVSAALAALRGAVRASPNLRLRVLVTGSLYLVGDTLRALGRPPT